MEKNIVKKLVIAVGFLCGLSTVATAGFNSTGAFFSVSSSAGSGSLTNVATPISTYAWANNGGWTGTNASVTWGNNVQNWSPITGSGFSNANIVVRNNTSIAQDFSVTVSMLGSASGPFVAAGSLGGQFVNGSGTLGSLTSTGPMWGAHIDGVAVNTQLNNALFFVQPYQIMSIGNFNFSTLPISGSIGNSLSINFALRLSAGGEASFTSVFSFQAVPGPASIALLGFMPLVRSRRRR